MASPSTQCLRQVSLEEIWPDLLNGIHEIFHIQNIKKSRYMALYTKVYDYCTTLNKSTSGPSSGRISMRNSSSYSSRTRTPGTGPVNSSNRGAQMRGIELYNKIKEFLHDFLTNLLEEAKEEADILKFYKDKWINFRFSSSVLHGMCRYVNATWIKRERDEGHRDVHEMFSLALVTWRKVFFIPLQKKLTPAILRQIEMERNGENVNSILISNVIGSYVELGLTDEAPKVTSLTVYENYFEKDFLESTETYYIAESAEFMSQNPITAYMKKAEQRLTEEAKRVQLFLHVSTADTLIAVCKKVLIEKQSEVFHTEFVHLLNDDKDEDVSRMYSLCSQLEGGLDQLKCLLEGYITNQGLDAISSNAQDAMNEPRVFVESIIAVHSKFNALVLTAFKNNPAFVAALDKACGKFINKNCVTLAAKSNNKSPELLARYCDNLLKKSSKNIEDAELDDLLNQVLVVFKYLDDKDVFNRYYAKLLAKRLVQATSASDDAESSMLSKLKSACGYEYTNKLQRMFQDISANKTTSEDFKQFLSDKEPDIDFNVLVLTSGSWPFKPTSEFTLPRELQRGFTHFDTFYGRQKSGRKLTWLWQLTKGELITNCFKNRYTLQASIFQLAVLLLFNNQTSMPYSFIKLNSGLTDCSQLDQVMETLLKAKLLEKSSTDAELTDATVFSLVKDYKNKKLRVNINFALKSEQKQEEASTLKTIEEDRKLFIQAAIVRIMKMRRTLPHQQLVAEVLKQVNDRFKASIQLIKKCIDLVIDKEFLKRHEEERNVYSYVA